VNALQIRVSKLRRALTSYDAGTISRDHGGYSIDVPESSIDAARFTTLLREARAGAAADRHGDGGGPTQANLDAYDRALDLFVGAPLADFPTEAWARQEAARLDGLHLAAVTERTELALALGRETEVIA